MARPRRAGLDYFPMDVTFFGDKKIKILKARFGADGLTLYLYILCEIYKDMGYFLKVDEDFNYTVSDDLNMSLEKIGQIMNFLLERSLLDSKLFQSDKVLTSHGIQTRYQEAVKERGKKNPVVVDERFWILEENETQSFIKGTLFDDCSKNNNSISENNPSFTQEKLHKGKERKEKERKGEEEESNSTTTLLSTDSNFSLYGKFNNVQLTDDQYQTIRNTYQNYIGLIDKVSGIIEKTPKKNHYNYTITIAEQDQYKSRPKPKQSDPIQTEPSETVPMPDEIREKMKGVYKKI